MSIDFTRQDINTAAEAAWKAIEDYGHQHHVCTGCLSGHVTIDMIYHVIRNTVADEALTGYLHLLDTARDAALAERQGSHSKPKPH